MTDWICPACGCKGEEGEMAERIAELEDALAAHSRADQSDDPLSPDYGPGEAWALKDTDL